MSKTLRKILTTSSALLMLASVGATSNNIIVNARHRRIHRVYRHHKSSWHYLSYNGNKEFRYSKSVSKYWRMSKEHWVLVKHNVPVHNISVANTDDAHPYSIGTKILKKGSIVKGYYPPSSPSGFHILKVAKGGFHISHHYEVKHAADWTVYPGGHPYHGLYSNYWMRAVK